MDGGFHDQQHYHRRQVPRSEKPAVRAWKNSSWVETIAAHDGLTTGTQFAIDLCLEEVLVNIILHGYAGSPDHTIVSACTVRDNSLVFVVDDEAPPFDPLEHQARPPGSGEDVMRPGGRGISLLRQFAHRLQYEYTSRGNRLSIGFAT